jgi:hypothetical protein
MCGCNREIIREENIVIISFLFRTVLRTGVCGTCSTGQKYIHMFWYGIGKERDNLKVNITVFLISSCRNIMPLLELDS